MSITRANARIYVAGILGGARSPQLTAAAEEAILRSFEDWQAAKFWRFLLKDTSLGFRVSGCNCTSGSAVINAPTTSAFDAVNVGVTVTVGGGETVTLPANTTVSSYTRNTDGTIASITLSNPFGGTNDTSTVLIFSGNIPLIIGTDEYNAPPDFFSFYDGRTLSNKRKVYFIEYRDWNRAVIDHTVRGLVEAVTVFNPSSDLTQNFGTKRLKVFRNPSVNDTLYMQYYREFNSLADPLDIPEDIKYKFLDYARWRLLESKTAHDDRLPQIEKMALGSLAQAVANDEEETEDQETAIISQQEVFGLTGGQRPLWSNGDFWPYPM